jgi:protein-tyrosine phosphatase
MTFTISFVCLGNICRSPTAEAVARHRIAERGLEGVEVESAGTGHWHVGNPPDARAAQTAARRDIVMEGTARQFHPDDLGRVDLVVAMDRSNLADLQRLADQAAARGIEPPPIRLLREWDPQATGDDRDVPDPYYGGPDGFDHVLDLITRSVDALLDDVVAGRARR